MEQNIEADGKKPVSKSGHYMCIITKPNIVECILFSCTYRYQEFNNFYNNYKSGIKTQDFVN